MKSKRDQSDTREIVEKASKLAFLHIDQDKIEELTNKAGNVLDYIDQLNKLDTSKVEPMKGAFTLEKTPLRDDVAIKFKDRDAILNIAPDIRGSYFKVPQVIEEE
ncbi:MAG: Asp-tRNA(Asn)/Glu-tRNA(Gln) amidotransferase subunit GatC [Pseudomonadota bacterium]